MAANQSTLLRADALPIKPEEKEHILNVLHKAAATFIRTNGNIVSIWAASRDWFLEEWGRDTFIALPGLLLSTNKLKEARLVFAQFARYEHAGLIPNRIREDVIMYNTADASLWFLSSLKRYIAVSKDIDFMRDMLPHVRAVIEGYRDGTTYEQFGKPQLIAMDPDDGLIVSPPQATWMDADPAADGLGIVTPRHGKAVEINALWYAGLRFAAELEEQCGETARMDAYTELAEQVRTSFQLKFWNETEHCLFDVVEGDPHAGAIRPNQILAVSHGEDLLAPSQQAAVLACVTQDLLTAGGLRTLSPRDSHYHGTYDTAAPVAEKDLAYHQGTVWPWLIGPYCDALALVHAREGKSESEIRNELTTIISPLVRFCLESEYKNLPEVFSGDPPHEPGGTTAQAWSVGETLRIVTDYGLLEE